MTPSLPPRRRRLRSRPALALVPLLLLTGCAAPPTVQPQARSAAASARPDPSFTYFFFQPGLPLGDPPVELLVNPNGSPRVERPEAYRAFRRDVAPLLDRWARDPRLGLNPNFVAALLTKESGFEPFATSHVPANGYPQLTHIADVDLRQITGAAPEWSWMAPEVSAWPRHPLVHRPDASKQLTDSLVARGVIHGGNEYFFDPRQSTRAAVFWLRILAQIWTEDRWPGMYGTFARTRLNGGSPLTEPQLLALVTVSYNQGHPYARDLVQRFGPDWTSHLNEEAADYLERIRHYTVVYQRAQGRGQ